MSLSFSLGGDAAGTDDDDHSVALFSSTGGKGFVVLAIVYLTDLSEYVDEALKAGDREQFGPLLRREPQTVMVDFIRAISGGKRVTWNYSLYPSTMYGPDTEGGHYVLHLHGDGIEHYTDSPWPTKTDQATMLKKFRDDPDSHLSPDLLKASEYIIEGGPDEDSG